MQPDRASKDSLGNLVLDTSSAIVAQYRAADVFQQLQLRPLLFIFWCQIEEDHWQSLDFLSRTPHQNCCFADGLRVLGWGSAWG